MKSSPTFTRIFKGLGILASGLVFLLVVVMSFPTMLAINVKNEQAREVEAPPIPFPVTVDPKNKLIVESDHVNAFLEGSTSPLQAAAGNTGSIIGRVFTLIATTIAEAPWYQSIAAVQGRFVTLSPGMRKEQVANAFGSALAWNGTQKKEFLTRGPYSSLPLAEGSFAPGIYFVDSKTTPLMAQALVNDKFSNDILSRYSTSTSAIVPLSQALTIASLIERETGGTDDMRLISGVIWNRLFLGMNLQIDATLQYVKASSPATRSWWPQPIPADRYRKSPYNTYMHAGLPPTPIASPSVATVLAALNPKSTSCIFYFHDKNGEFHCTDTYAQHVALLKKYYGRGK